MPMPPGWRHLTSEEAARLKPDVDARFIITNEQGDADDVRNYYPPDRKFGIGAAARQLTTALPAIIAGRGAGAAIGAGLGAPGVVTGPAAPFIVGGSTILGAVLGGGATALGTDYVAKNYANRHPSGRVAEFMRQAEADRAAHPYLSQASTLLASPAAGGGILPSFAGGAKKAATMAGIGVGASVPGQLIENGKLDLKTSAIAALGGLQTKAIPSIRNLERSVLGKIPGYSGSRFSEQFAPPLPVATSALDKTPLTTRAAETTGNMPMQLQPGFKEELVPFYLRSTIGELEQLKTSFAKNLIRLKRAKVPLDADDITALAKGPNFETVATDMLLKKFAQRPEAPINVEEAVAAPAKAATTPTMPPPSLPADPPVVTPPATPIKPPALPEAPATPPVVAPIVEPPKAPTIPPKVEPIVEPPVVAPVKPIATAKPATEETKFKVGDRVDINGNLYHVSNGYVDQKGVSHLGFKPIGHSKSVRGMTSGELRKMVEKGEAAHNPEFDTSNYKLFMKDLRNGKKAARAVVAKAPGFKGNYESFFENLPSISKDSILREYHAGLGVDEGALSEAEVQAGSKKKVETKQFPNTGQGSPAGEYGEIYGPKLTSETVARFRSKVGEAVNLPEPQTGVTAVVKYKPGMLWVETNRRLPGPGNEFEAGVAYMAIRADGTTVLDASKHGRPIDKLAADSLLTYLRQSPGEKSTTATIPKKITGESGMVINPGSKAGSKKVADSLGSGMSKAADKNKEAGSVANPFYLWDNRRQKVYTEQFDIERRLKFEEKDLAGAESKNLPSDFLEHYYTEIKKLIPEARTKYNPASPLPSIKELIAEIRATMKERVAQIDAEKPKGQTDESGMVINPGEVLIPAAKYVAGSISNKLRPGLERIGKNLGPIGAKFKKKYEQMRVEARQFIEPFQDEIHSFRRTLTSAEEKKLHEALMDRADSNTPPSGLTPRELDIIKRHDDIINLSFLEKTKPNSPFITTFDASGNIVTRPPRQTPYYTPALTTPSKKFWSVISKGSDSAEWDRYRSLFTANIKREIPNMSDESANRAWVNYTNLAAGRNKPNAQYAQLRLPEGVRLPRELRANAFDALERMVNSQGHDLAFHRNLESDPELGPALGYEFNGRGEKYEAGRNILGSNEDVQYAMRDFVGGTSPVAQKFEAANRLITGLLVQTYSQARNLAQTPGVLLEILNPDEYHHVVTGLVKAIFSRSAQKEAMRRGSVRASRNVNPANALGNETMNTLTDGMNKLSDIIQSVTLNEPLERGHRTFFDAVFKPVSMNRLAKGDVEFFDRIGPHDWRSWDADKLTDYTTARLSQMSAGGYSAEGLPNFLLRGEASLPKALFSLSRWSIERTNHFINNVIEPAKKGNIKPLIGSLLGHAISAGAINWVAEQMTGRKPKELTWNEYFKLGNKDTVYTVLSKANTAAFGGILSNIAFQAAAATHGELPRGYTNPALVAASETLERLFQYVNAVELGDVEPLAGLFTLGGQLLKDRVQLIRMMSADEPIEGMREEKIASRIGMSPKRTLSQNTLPSPFTAQAAYRAGDSDRLRKIVTNRMIQGRELQTPVFPRRTLGGSLGPASLLGQLSGTNAPSSAFQGDMKRALEQGQVLQRALATPRQP